MVWRIPEAQPSADHEIAPGLIWTLKPLVGELRMTATGMTSQTMSRLGEGKTTLEELGYDDGEIGLLSDTSILFGLSRFVAAVEFAMVCLEAWNVVDDDEQPVEITRANVRQVLSRSPEALEGFTAIINGDARVSADEGKG